MAVNDSALDRQILHLVALQRRYASLDNSTQRRLDRHFKEITNIIASDDTDSRKLRRLSSQVKSTYRSLETSITNNLVGLAKNEMNFAKNNLQKSMGSLATVRNGSLGSLKAFVSNSSLSNKLSDVSSQRSFRQWIRDIGTKELTDIENTYKAGVIAGKSASQITQDLQDVGGGLKRSRANARSLSRTIFTNVSNSASDAVYIANKDLLKGYQWLSTLDNRTSGICRNRDGKVFEVGSGIYPVAHWNCRSTTIPIVKELSELPVPQRRKDALSARRRASFNGAVPISQNYEQWLRGQSREVQDSVLGQFRADVFRKGRVSLEQMSDIFGKPVTLYQLQKLDSSIIESNSLPTAAPVAIDARAGDIKVPVIKVNDLLKLEDELVTFFTSQSQSNVGKSANVNFASVNLSLPYREHLRSGARPGTFIDRRQDIVSGEIVDFTRDDLDVPSWLNELRLLNESTVLTAEQKTFINTILTRLDITLEGNQRIIAVRSLRRIFERNDFDPDVRDINAFLTSVLNRSAQDYVRSSGRARAKALPSFADIQANPSGRTKAIRALDNKFKTYARKNGSRVDDALGTTEGLTGEQILLFATQTTSRRLGTSLPQIAEAIGDYINPNASTLVKIRAGEKVLGILREDMRVGYARVIRKVGTKRPVKKVGDTETITSDANIIVVDSVDAQLAQYYTLLEEDRVYSNLLRTKSKVKPVQAGTTDGLLQDASNFYPDRTLDSPTADQINYAQSVGYTVNQQMLAVQQYNLVANDGPFNSLKNLGARSSVKRIVSTLENAPKGTIFYENDLDVRSRIYAKGYATPQGQAEARYSIDFAEKVPLGSNGYTKLAEGIGEVLTDENTYAARIAAFEEVKPKLLSLGEDIANGTLDNLYLRHPFLNGYKADEIPLLQRYALEFYNIDKWERLGRNANSFPSNLITHRDATASAFQMAAVATRSSRLANISNVVDTPFAERPYRVVGQNAFDRAIREQNFESPNTAILLKQFTEAQVTKLVKHPTMTTVYGVTQRGLRDQLESSLRNLLVGDNAEIADLFDLIPLSDIERLGRVITRTIDTDFPEVGAYFRFLSDVAEAVDGPMTFLTPDGATVTLSKHLKQKKTLELDIDGVPVVQRYTEYLDDYDPRAIISSTPANFTHALDGTVNRIALRKARERGLNITSIHDSWGTHAGRVDEVIELVKEAYVEVYESNPLVSLLEHLRATNQLSLTQYNSLLEQLLEGVDVNGRNVSINPAEQGFGVEDILQSTYIIS